MDKDMQKNFKNTKKRKKFSLYSVSSLGFRELRISFCVLTQDLFPAQFQLSEILLYQKEN